MAPNGRAWLDATAAAAARPFRSAVVVDSPEPTTFPSLGYSAAEVRAVDRALPGAEVLSGTAATVDAIVRALTGKSLAHFSCHGVADPLATERTGIVLSGNALLRAGDLLDADLSGCRLAVLSACESAAIEQELPDEVFGLPAALLSAGVPGVVAALWNVPSSSALFLAIGLYRRLQAGQMPPACFRDALRWLRDSTNEAKARELEAVMDVAGSVELATLVRRLRSAPGSTWFADPAFWAPFLYMGV